MDRSILLRIKGNGLDINTNGPYYKEASYDKRLPMNIYYKFSENVSSPYTGTQHFKTCIHYINRYTTFQDLHTLHLCLCTSEGSILCKNWQNPGRKQPFLVISCFGYPGKIHFWVGPWSNGYQCGKRILQPGFNFQRMPDHGC